MGLLHQPVSPVASLGNTSTADTRDAYEHPLLSSLPNLSENAKSSVLSKNRLAQLAKEHGLHQVLRWRPKKADNLSGSGLELVLAQSVYAIVGAISLEQGGVVAGRVAREKILRPLGIEVPDRD